MVERNSGEVCVPVAKVDDPEPDRPLNLHTGSFCLGVPITPDWSLFPREVRPGKHLVAEGEILEESVCGAWVQQVYGEVG